MFKNFIYILFSAVMIFAVWSLNSSPIFKNYSNEFEVYSYAYSSNCVIEKKDESGFVLCFNKTGEAVEFYGDSLADIIRDFDAEIKFTESMQDVYTVYAYSPKIKVYVTVGKEKINLVISQREDVIKVGSPFIYGSF